MLKRISPFVPVVLSLVTAALFPTTGVNAHAPSASNARPHAFLARAAAANDEREQDGLVGPVRRVRTETAKVTVKDGKIIEGPRKVLETATYDIKGAKIDNQYFLQAGGSLTGKEVYKYDDKGNITEMVLFNADGTLLSKETYAYEFDAVGNWTKMVTSVAVLEGGKVTYEPSEVTYRVIAYYLEEGTVAKLTQAAPSAAATAQPNATARSATPAPANASPVNASHTNVSATNSSPAPQPNNAAQSKPAAASKTEAGAASSKPAVVPASLSSSSARPAPALSQPEIAALDKSKLAAPRVASAPGAPVVKDDGEEAPLRPVMRGPVKPVSGGVLNGKAVKLPAPDYPLYAKQLRLTGVVTVEVVIDVTGKVISARATSGHEQLRRAAEQAAMQARFSPTMLSGQPVKIAGTINYNFTLGR